MAASAEKMIPKSPDRPSYRKQEKGNPRRPVTVRVDGRVREWLEEAEAKKMTVTSALLRAAETAIRAADELDMDWWEIERLANVEGVHAGVILGRLAKAALGSKGKK